MQQKMIPQNIEAEQSVLGAMLIDGKAVETALALLKPEDFYRPAHQIIFRAMQTLHEKHMPVDLVTIVDELKRIEKLDDAGGISFITLIANAVPTAANIRYHADIVAEKAFYRQLVESGTEIASLGYEASGEIDGLFDLTEKKLTRLAGRKQTRGIVPIDELVCASMDNINALIEKEDAITGLSTGFTDLDNMTFGLQASDFIILAARPSVGKTALALNIAENVALRGMKDGGAPKRVAYFSLEMSSEQLVHRMICSEAEVQNSELRGCGAHAGTDAPDKSETDDIRSRLWNASGKIAAACIYIDDTPNLSIVELRSQARKLKAEGGLDLIIIDYLQLMQSPTQRNGFENRQSQVTEISRGLKALARELRVPVLALSQLSRSVETRQEKRPLLSDLRESGSLEQDADIVMFLYREDYYRHAPDSYYGHASASPVRPTELIIAKHRNGPTGKIDLFFNSDLTKFVGLNEADAG